MKTADLLKTIPDKHMEWFRIQKGLKEKALLNGNRDFAKEIDSHVRGYIRCLVDCGIISQPDFKTLWCWFTI